MTKIKLPNRPEGYLFPLNNQGSIDSEGNLTLMVYESCQFKEIEPLENWYPNARIESEIKSGFNIEQFNNCGFKKPQLSVIPCKVTDNIQEHEEYHVRFDDDEDYQFEAQDGPIKQVRFDNLTRLG